MSAKPRAELALEATILVLLLLLGASATVAYGFDAVAKTTLLEAQFLQLHDSRSESR